MADSLWSVQGEALANPVRVDETDLAILHELTMDARLANNVLAARVGLAPSTCLGRVKALVKAGVITGFAAQVNEKLLGISVQAMISVMVAPAARQALQAEARKLTSHPEVKDVFVLGGAPDLLVHVAARSVDDLRRFVAAALGGNRAFSSTQTALVFEHLS